MKKYHYTIYDHTGRIVASSFNTDGYDSHISAYTHGESACTDKHYRIEIV
jgi:hypothetical protein